jgi:hypothetical protein
VYNDHTWRSGISVPLVTTRFSNEGGVAVAHQHTFQSRKRLGSGQAYTKAKRIVSPIYSFIEGREENFLLVPMKSEEAGVPHLLRQQHNQ